MLIPTDGTDLDISNGFEIIEISCLDQKLCKNPFRGF